MCFGIINTYQIPYTTKGEALKIKFHAHFFKSFILAKSSEGVPKPTTACGTINSMNQYMEIDLIRIHHKLCHSYVKETSIPKHLYDKDLCAIRLRGDNREVIDLFDNVPLVHVLTNLKCFCYPTRISR